MVIHLAQTSLQLPQVTLEKPLSYVTTQSAKKETLECDCPYHHTEILSEVTREMGFSTGDEPQYIIAFDLVIFASISSLPVTV